MGLFTSLLICLAINFGVSILLSSLGVQIYIIDIVTNFVLALVFSIINFRKDPEGMLRNPRFHKSFATLFIVLLAVTFILGYLL